MLCIYLQNEYILQSQTQTLSYTPPHTQTHRNRMDTLYLVELLAPCVKYFLLQVRAIINNNNKNTNNNIINETPPFPRPVQPAPLLTP